MRIPARDGNRVGYEPLVHVPRDASGTPPVRVDRNDRRDPLVHVSGRQYAIDGKELGVARQIGCEDGTTSGHRLDGGAVEAN